MIENGRIGRFVGAARKLMLMQLAAALLAVALAGWAVFAVWELAAERDRLRAQLDAAPASAAAAAGPAAPIENPLDNEVRLPAILPIPIPVPEATPDVNILMPDANGAGPATNQAADPVDNVQKQDECAGPNANPARCPSGRWTRPIPQRPIPRAQPEPQQPGAPATPPRAN